MAGGVGMAGGGDAVESGLDRAIADGVHVNDESLLVGGDAEFGELPGIEQQFAVAAAVAIGLGQVGGLGRIFGDAVGENLDAGDVQVRNVAVGGASLLDGGEFGGGIFGEDLREGDDF